MKREERAGRLDTVVDDFMAHYPGSRVVSRTQRVAILRTGGMNADSRRLHLMMCALTLGLWFPVWLITGLVSEPRDWTITVDTVTGDVEVCEQ